MELCCNLLVNLLNQLKLLWSSVRENLLSELRYKEVTEVRKLKRQLDPELGKSKTSCAKVQVKLYCLLLMCILPLFLPLYIQNVTAIHWARRWPSVTE